LIANAKWRLVIKIKKYHVLKKSNMTRDD